MRGRQLSYRRRRRLVWLAVFAVIAGGVTAGVVLLPKGHKLDRGPSVSPPPASPAAAHRPHPMHLTAADRDQLRSTIALFISSSVARRHPERSWSIVHPTMREGMTKRQWSSGNIPVVPFPAAGLDLFTLQSAADQKVLAEVLLEPPPKSTLVRKTFQIELQRAPQALHGWVVSAWVPEGVSQSQIDKNASTTPASVVAAAYHAQHLSAKWILVPLGILLGGVILLPTGLFVRQAYQSRRAKAQARTSYFDGTGRLRR